MRSTVMVSKKKKGFTIIEVALFLAISGALLAMVIAGTSTSVARRRYEDATNDLVEEIRNAYSATINVQNSRIKTEDSSWQCSIASAFESGTLVINGKGKYADNYPGRTRCAVYGQLLTFGEKEKGKNRPDSRTVHRYDIIGIALEDNIEPDSADSIDQTLASLRDRAKADVVTVKKSEMNNKISVQLAGGSVSYQTQWEATIEQKGSERKPFVGAVMIVRSPVSGTVHTYTYTADETSEGYDNIFEIQDFLASHSTAYDDISEVKDESFVWKAINEGKFQNVEDAVLCVGSDDLFAISNRRAIRVQVDGSTEAAVELLPMDISPEEGACEK